MQQMYMNEEIRYFEKRVLTEGLCKAYLPMKFIGVEGNEIADIDTAGFKALSCFELRNSIEAVTILEKCVLALIDACGYLVDPKRMEFNIKTVFLSAGKKDVRFAFIPRAMPAENAVCLVRGLVDDMDKNIVRGEATSYLRACASYLPECESLFDLITFLSELKEEINSCGA